MTINSADNAYPAEDIVLDSGDRIEVTYSYRGGAKTMKEALIDKIRVNPTADGSEPHVAFVVDGEGLKNDVDFSEQPHLWLSSPPKGQTWQNGNYKVLVGLYEPYGDTYKFGYGGTSWAGESGILVTNLVDNPVSGTPRNIVLAGKGVTCIRSLAGGKCTLSGSLTVGENADLGTGSTVGYGNLAKITFKDGSRFVLKATSGSLNAKTEVEFNGSVGVSVNGGGSVDNPPKLTINGDVSGSGTITLIDQGGIAFTGTNNTYSGTLKSSNTTAGDVPQLFQVGNGAQFSWGTGTIVTKRGRECVLFNADSNLACRATVTGPGRLVKRGKGVLTLANPPDRTGAVAAGLYALEIENGGFALDGEVPAPMQGMVKLSSVNSCFDVCGRADTTYLPEGRGKVLSTGGSHLILKGGWTNDVVFSGTLDCSADVELLDRTVWRLAERTSLGGDLNVRSGTAVMGAFFATDHDVTVDAAATLKFNSDDYWARKDLTGLKIDFWDIESRCQAVGSSHSGRLDAALEATESELPMHTADMTEFTLLQNGDNTNGSNKDCPFAKVLGAYNAKKYGSDPNYFAAVFGGLLHIEQAGTYRFRMRADDSGIVWLDDEQIIRFANGNSGAVSSTVSRNLAAGDHPFKVLFCEESGWDVLMVEIQGPDVPEWQCVPVSMLRPCVDNGVSLGALKGTGAIGLEPNGIWPVSMPTDAFTGRVVVDENTKASTSGALALASATLAFDNGWDVFGRNWTLCGQAVFDAALGRTAIRATPGMAKANGGLNTSFPIPVTGPWSVEFDFSAVEPFAANNNIGDGFAMVLHTGGAAQTTGGTFQYTEGSKRVNCSSAYGIQCFINRDWNYSVWMKGGNAYAEAGGFETNTTRFTMTRIKNHPMHMKMEYDGQEKMVVSYAVDDIILARTNTCAGADLAALFPNGAYLGIWAANGDAYASACIDNVQLTIPGTTDAVRPEFGGSLVLSGGEITALGIDGGVLSGDLAVKGAVTFSSEVPLDVTSSAWTFDVGTGSLAFSGPCRFKGPVTVELVGEAPKGKTLLADFTETSGTLPTVALGAGQPAKLSLAWRDRKLYLDNSQGLVILFK